jgi:hypothetical protein
MQGTYRLTGMCVHEHQMTSRYCHHHATELIDQTVRLSCIPCRRSERPHRCLVSVVASEVAS